MSFTPNAQFFAADTAKTTPCGSTIAATPGFQFFGLPLFVRTTNAKSFCGEHLYLQNVAFARDHFIQHGVYEKSQE
jgi:hypothetical protein